MSATLSDKEAAARDLAMLEEILKWTRRVRELSNSPRWKNCLHNESIIDDYADACDAVWAGLDQLLDIREARGNPVSKMIPAPDYKKQIKSAITAALKVRLPSILLEAVEEAVEEVEI